MRLLICAGGTGGGVYPALAVLQAVADRVEQTLWVGGQGGMEAALVARTGVPFAEISAAGVHGVGLAALPGNLIKLGRGYSQARRILRDFQPHVLFFTGGYVAVPMALAGAGVRKLLYVPDIEPGLALKALAKFANIIALTDESSTRYFSKKKQVVVTGYPLRGELQKVPREQALQTFKFTAELPVLLVIGGSKGAHSINQAVFDNLPTLLHKTQVLHLTGQQDWEEANSIRLALEVHLGARYQPYPYLHEEMSAAFSCANLVLSRAGASTLGELPFYGLPAILVPYPYAWRYQKVNANHLTQSGAALTVENNELSDRLGALVDELLSDPQRLTDMGKKMGVMAAPDAARKIADLLVLLAEEQDRKSVV